jgi:hypothetical protein
LLADQVVAEDLAEIRKSNRGSFRRFPAQRRDLQAMSRGGEVRNDAVLSWLPVFSKL